MSIDPTLLSNFFLILTAFSIAFMVTLWASLIFWVSRDTQHRIKDPLVRILAILLVVILFIPGIIIYLILRPPSSLEAEYQRALEEEALLQSIDDRIVCPNCGYETHKDWRYCPKCNSQIKVKCQKCENLLELQWKVCPYCGSSAPEPIDSKSDFSVGGVYQSPDNDTNIISPVEL